jgi:plastocyanin
MNWAVRGAVFALGFAGFAAAADAETIRLTIKDLEFTPVEVRARVGDTVEWVNTDFIAHTATALNGDWDVRIDRGATGRVTLTKAGVVAYYCRYHPNMKATITVAED